MVVALGRPHHSRFMIYGIHITTVSEVQNGLRINVLFIRIVCE